MRTQRPGLLRTQRIHLVALLLFASEWLCAAGDVRGAQEPSPKPVLELSLEQYRAELDRCAEVMQRPSEIRALQDSLPPVWIVRADEKRIEVPTQAVRSQLHELQVHPGNPAVATRELRLVVNAMKKEAEEMAPSSDRGGSAEQAQARLQGILNRKEFQSARGPSGAEILMNRIALWLFGGLARLFSKLHLNAKAGNVVVWAIIGLAFLALSYIVWKWLSSRQPQETGLPVFSVPASEARQWVQEALDAAERGDYRAALHCAYWGAIARLEDLGRLSRDRARTPRESLRLLEDRPGDHRLLHALTGIFERVWYGYRAASPADWTGAKELLEKIGCLEASIAPTAHS